MNLLKKPKTIYIVFAKLLLTFAAFYIISKRVTINPLNYINKQSIDYFLLAIMFSLLIIFLQAIRWRYIAKIYAIQLPYLKCLIAIWFGNVVNNFLPATTAGDLLRSYTLRYADSENRKWKWLGAFLSEKYSAAVSALLVACAAFTTAISGQIPLLLMSFIILLFASLILLPIITTLVLNSLKIDGSKKTIIYLHEISKSLSNTFQNKNGRSAFLISMLTSLCMCIIFYIIALGLGVQLKFTQCMFVVPAFTILATLPISYAGWGVRELSCVGLLSFFGVSSEIAVIISIIYGFIILISSLPGIIVAYPFVSSMRVLAKQEAS